ncbi:MAG: YgiQ family radical SAM protein [candidate division WOR-3 bacterium]
MSRAEMERLGWDQCDCIIVSGDAYVDHPSFGPAVICRVLIDAGFRVGVIAQPDWRTEADFLALGRPRLFFGITAGNVDSMVANYSPNLVPRKHDDYSAGGRSGQRPNRACIVYANRLRQLFRGVPLVLGGIEASLRRLAHYDYWEDTVRGSILIDAKADILVYGMGERQVKEIAARLTENLRTDLSGIPGTCVTTHKKPEKCVELPALETVRRDRDAFNLAFRLWYGQADNPLGKVVVQKHGDRYVVQYPAPQPLSTSELDRVYNLPYTRQAHPSYRERIPALETVRFSITSHRGCLGSCTFCSLRAHQGRIVQSRSLGSIVREAEAITRLPEFRGHITDVGGPTANMYGATCVQMAAGRVCMKRECLFPERCPSLKLAYERHLIVLEAVSKVKGVRRVSIGTGIRFDLLDGRQGERYLRELCCHYISGQMRVAPEHVAPRVLAAMHKSPPEVYLAFRRRFLAAVRSCCMSQSRLFLVPYFISGHPGANLEDAVELAEHLVKVERFFIRQVQQFTPLPMTAAGVAYHTGKDPLTGKPLHVARTAGEKRLQRALLQLFEPKNVAYVERELTRLGRRDLLARIRRLKSRLRSAGTAKVRPSLSGELTG